MNISKTLWHFDVVRKSNHKVYKQIEKDFKWCLGISLEELWKVKDDDFDIWEYVIIDDYDVVNEYDLVDDFEMI